MHTYTPDHSHAAQESVNHTRATSFIASWSTSNTHTATEGVLWGAAWLHWLVCGYTAQNPLICAFEHRSIIASIDVSATCVLYSYSVIPTTADWECSTKSAVWRETDHLDLIILLLCSSIYLNKWMNEYVEGTSLYLAWG